jgi:hypothetical protein
MKRPNFFIAGAPRCGTTALYSYLSEHPDIFMSEVKELNYFAFDFPNVQKITFKSELDYLKVFEKANHLAIGEASPFYLYSQVAFTNIRKFNPKAKIILTLRSPINFVQSFHQLNLSLLREDEENLEKAWELQDQRRQGKQIPASCRQPEMILYGELGLFGKYVERLLAIFPRDQVLIIIFEDFARHPQEIYEKILAFIGVPSDGRTEFPPVNSNFSNKSKLLAKIFHPPQSIYKAFIKVISLFGVNFMKFVSIVYNKIETLNTKRTNREPLSPEFKAKLKIYFQKDVQTLSALMNRDLSFWLE